MTLNIPFETALQLLVMTYVALIRLLSTSNLRGLSNAWTFVRTLMSIQF